MKDTQENTVSNLAINTLDNTKSKLTSKTLFDALWSQLTNTAVVWLQTALSQLEVKKHDSNVLQNSYFHYSAIAKRKLGIVKLINIPSHANWRVDEAARLLLLSKVLSLSAPEYLYQQVKDAFKFGDESEQIAIIKGLSLIDPQGVLSNLAVTTGRTNSLNLFTAIALNNDYPAQHYLQREYQQLVLKSLFMDIDISQIIGLKQRRCPELSVLAMDLIKERLVANRQPPSSIYLAINFTDLTQEEQKLYLDLSDRAISK